MTYYSILITHPCRYRRLPDASLLPSDPLRDALKRALPKSLAWTEREMGREPPEDVSTATYAAVLVFFVGTTKSS
ncbi:hypothetical protein PG987_001509 [Apiospora arundinis]